MMSNISPGVIALLVAVSSLDLAAAGGRIEAVVKPTSVDAANSGDPDVVIFTVKFDLIVKNGSTTPTDLPKPGPDTDVTRITLLAVQSLRADGGWANVVQSSFYDTGNLKYDSCVSLQPSATLQLPAVEGRVVLLRKRLTDLGNHPTLRFNIMTLCKQPNGSSGLGISKGFNLLSTQFMTESFDIQLPELPK